MYDPVRARVWLARACGAVPPQAEACEELGRLRYLHGEFGTAREALGRACGLGRGSACASLCRLHKLGQGGPKDLVAAEALCGKACAMGAREGCRAQAELLREVGQPERALAVLRRACEGGSAAACHDVALALGVGSGEAAGMRAQACALGLAVACLELAEGMDGWLDPTRVAGWRLRACALGSQRACGLITAR